MIKRHVEGQRGPDGKQPHSLGGSLASTESVHPANENIM